MKLKVLLMALFMLTVFSSTVLGEPTSEPTNISSIRPYIGSGDVFIQVSNTLSLCNSDTYKIDTSKPNGKNAYAVALSAMLSGKKVKLELINSSSACNTAWGGWGAELQSIYLINQ